MKTDRDLSQWLLENERKAILPFKWALWGVALIFWLWKTHWMLPGIGCFSVFNTYFLILLAMTYLMVMRRITVREAHVFCIFSFLMDLAFVSLLIYADNKRMMALGVREMSNYYYFYFVLAMRGYSLSTTQVFNLLINLLIVGLMIASFALSEASFGFLLSGSFQIQLAYLWLVILMSWYIVGLINQQKEELMAARERLLATQHMADLGEMAAVVAHEVNNPIGIISANAEYLMKKASDRKDIHEDLRVIRDESQRCKQIVTELLSYAQPRVSSPLQRTDWASLCREVAQFAFRVVSAEALQVDVRIEPDTPQVMADPASLRQALLNVFINAKQAVQGLKEAGTIDIRMARDAVHPGMVELSVGDNGPGIAPEDVERAFEPFFTRKRGGTGLGLAVTRRMIESQRGAVAIAPRKDARGTVVILRLPAAE